MGSHLKKLKDSTSIMGEGMPWNIILVCMMLGFALGINSAKKDQKAQDEADKEKKP